MSEGDLTLDMPISESVQAHDKMQKANTERRNYEEQPEESSARSLATGNLKPESRHVDKVAVRHSGSSDHLVCPSKLPGEGTLPITFPCHESELQPPGRANLTGFLGTIVQRDQNSRVYHNIDDGALASASKELKDDQQRVDEEYSTREIPRRDEILASEASGPFSGGSLLKSTILSSFASTPSKGSLSRTDSVTIRGSSSTTAAVSDSLLYLMANASLQGSGQTSSMRITIPRAYELSISTDHKCHYDHMTHVKAVTQQRGPTKLKRKREDPGFKPDELIKKGALYTIGMDAVCSLDGKVHRVFEEKNWTDCPHQIYEFFKPGLLLATNLLSRSQCLQHFQTVLRGNRQYCLDTSVRKQKTCYRIKEDVPLTSKASEELREHIDALASTLMFQFLDVAPIYHPDQANVYFATAQAVPCKHSSCSISAEFRTSKRSPTIISMHPDFYIQAQKLCSLQYPDPDQVFRFQFFFATCLVHEFAHAFEIACSPQETSLGNEVHLYDCFEAESGRQWETNVFGGLVTPINARADCSHGICVMEWPEPGWRNVSRLGQRDVWAIPMSYIQELFLQSFWEGLREKSITDKSLLHIPKTGARSVALASFTTVRLEDVLEDRELGGLELALRDIEGETEIPIIDPDDDDGEEERKCRKRRKA